MAPEGIVEPVDVANLICPGAGSMEELALQCQRGSCGRWAACSPVCTIAARREAVAESLSRVYGHGSAANGYGCCDPSSHGAPVWGRAVDQRRPQTAQP